MTRRAFSLVELLVVIVVIGLLVAVGVPVWQSGRLTADRAAGKSQYRQIGAGIKAYASDRGGRLPGPLWPGQMPMLDPARDGRLCRDLAPYLDIDLPAAPKLVPLFIPPAYARKMGRAFLDESLTHVMNMAVSVGDAVINPFGSLRWRRRAPARQHRPRHRPSCPTPTSSIRGSAALLEGQHPAHPHLPRSPHRAVFRRACGGNPGRRAREPLKN
ncbi:MAG: prepilin-type N-terminal cleavage/methylation domain-containing protein [Kiritimatiellia bacterium]